MSEIAKTAAPAVYTPEQKKALERLHQAASQLEGVFLNMLLSEMRKTVPQQSIFGKNSQTEEVFQGMLDQQRADDMAKSGSFGIARVLENQLRESVLGDAKRESEARVPGAIEP